jgi:hypothetical protein
MLVELFHWPLHDLAKTDIDMLLPFVVYYPHWKSKQSVHGQEEQIYADEAAWL